MGPTKVRGKKPCILSSEKQQKSVRRCVKRSAWGERDFCTRTRPIRATNFRHPPRGGRAGGLQEIDGAERRSASSSFASLSPTPTLFLLPASPPDLSRRRAGKELGNSGAQWLLQFFVSLVKLVYGCINLQSCVYYYGFSSDGLLNLNNDITSSKCFFRQLR